MTKKNFKWSMTENDVFWIITIAIFEFLFFIIGVLTVGDIRWITIATTVGYVLYWSFQFFVEEETAKQWVNFLSNFFIFFDH